MSSIITARSGKDTTIYDSPTFDKDLRIHVKEAVGSASISPSGRDVVLASQQGLHIIDLDSPFSPPRHLRHQTPWIPADVQWSPFAARYYWVISTSNQRALVWNLELASLQAPIEHTLHAHSRAITDINFSASHPDLLATCAVDAFVHCWDLRQPARPVVSFSDWFAGATQVKWNRQDSHIVASSHDKYLHIWDDRKGALPLKTIEAHETKIYGIDWNRTHATKIVTCSLDRTIKLWDYEVSETEPERIINTPFPVWRARHTPFGSGILAMPQRGSHDLHMYHRQPPDADRGPSQTKSDFSFTGHDEQVKEFLWRARGAIDDHADNRDFQLVSWGADHELILHRMGGKQLRAVGHQKGMHVDQSFPLTRRGAPYKSFRDRPPQPGMAIETAAHSERSGLPLAGTSPGMNKAPIPITGGWADGGSVMTYSGMETRNVKKPDNGLISWMKGVRFGKRTASFPEQRHSRRLSAIADMQNVDVTGLPENLSDEIIHVSDKFTKVTFEEADVSNRHVKVSFNGPWAPEEKLAFMQLSMDFPLDYPEKSPPWFHLDKASALPERRVEELENNLRKIAAGYLIHQRGCIEGILSYLLGERDFQESTDWLGITHHDGIKEQAESSSDEEDGLLGDFGGSESQTLGLEGSMGSGIFSLNANVPLPRTCGAFWAPNGQLIYFLPPKEEPRSILQKFAVDDRSRARGSREIFEGFGRLNTNQADLRTKSKTLDALEEDESDNGSEFTSSSSSSSGSDGPEILLRRFQPPAAWHGGSLRFPRLRTQSTEGSLPTSSGKKTSSVRHKTIVKVLDTEYLLPAKRALGAEYLIFGDGETICSHNASVASHNGAPELADIWEFVGLILSQKVPLQLLSVPSQEADIHVLAQRSLVHIQRNDSGLDLSFDEPEAVLNPREKALVKWGNHPLAGSWLIQSLFEYFENIADLQMLGMLACVFAQTVSTGTQHPVYEEFPISMTCAAQSLDYFPNEAAAVGFYEPIISVSNTSNRRKMAEMGSGSAESARELKEREQLASEPVTPFSTDDTPPMPLSRGSTYRSSLAPSLSTSPEQYRTSTPSAQSSFAASVLTRPFNLASSPPIRNRLSGEELSSSLPSNSGITWSKGTRPSHRSNSTIRRSYVAHELGDEYDDGSTTEEEELPASQARVAISLKNQNMFDNEGCASVPFLDPAFSGKFALYREVYAGMLGAWDLRMQQNEISKYNGIVSLAANKSRDRNSQTTLTLGKFQIDEEVPVALGPHVVRSSASLQCTVCYQPIKGLYKVCLACGHAAHTSCLSSLLDSLAEDEDPECEAGCECACDQNLVVKGEEAFGFAGASDTDQGTTRGVGFQMLQPENSSILNRRGSIVDAKQANKLRERAHQEPFRVTNRGLRRTRTRSFGH